MRRSESMFASIGGETAGQEFAEGGIAVELDPSIEQPDWRILRHLQDDGSVWVHSSHRSTDGEAGRWFQDRTSEAPTWSTELFADVDLAGGDEKETAESLVSDLSQECSDAAVLDDAREVFRDHHRVTGVPLRHKKWMAMGRRSEDHPSVDTSRDASSPNPDGRAGAGGGSAPSRNAGMGRGREVGAMGTEGRPLGARGRWRVQAGVLVGCQGVGCTVGVMAGRMDRRPRPRPSRSRSRYSRRRRLVRTRTAWRRRLFWYERSVA